MADYNSDRTGSNIDAVLDKADNLTQAAVGVGGNVGIGTASPSAMLELNSATANKAKLKIGRITSLTNSLELGTDGGESTLTAIGGSGVNGGMIFKRGNGTTVSESMRLDSSGNLLVGMTAPSNAIAGMYVRPSSSSGFIGDGTNAINLGRNNSDGIIANFLKDGSPVGSIGSYSGQYLAIGNNTSGLSFIDQGTPHSIRPHNVTTNTSSDDLLNLGDSGSRFKDLYLSGGVYLGGTGAANKLDDYEEGVWTPTLGSLTTGSTFTYSLQSGSYVKVGRKVTVNGNIVLTNASGGSGSIVVSSLPFTISSNGATRPSGVIGYCGLLLNGTASILLGSNGTTYAAIYRADPSEVSHVAVPRTDIDGNEIFRFSLTYETDS